MRLELIVQTYGQLTDVVGRLPEFCKWYGKAPLLFDSLDPAFAHLCRIEVPEGYFRVTHAIPKPSRKQAFLWYEIKPRALTPTSDKDALVWDAQYTRGDWVPNKFGAVRRSLGQPVFQKVRKQTTPDFIAPDSGPYDFFVDAQLCSLLAGELGGRRALPATAQPPGRRACRPQGAVDEREPATLQLPRCRKSAAAPGRRRA
jgi:hypothetical protein